MKSVMIQQVAKDAIYLHMILKTGLVVIVKAIVKNVRGKLAFHAAEGINLIQRANVLILVNQDAFFAIKTIRKFVIIAHKVRPFYMMDPVLVVVKHVSEDAMPITQTLAFSKGMAIIYFPKSLKNVL